MLIDTHCHLNFSAFKDDSDEVIKRTLSKNIWLINVGSQYSTSERAVQIAQKYEKGVYAAVGLHPIHLFEQEIDESEDDPMLKFKSRVEVFDYEKYKTLVQNQKVVAIGECGLDYFRIPREFDKEEVKRKQRETFIQQIQLAVELKKPLIIHCRNAYDDLIEILKTYNLKPKIYQGVVHFFAGSWQVAEQLFKLGFLISFTGVITYASDYDKVIEKAPLDKIMVETDAPYVAPEPHRGKKNEPLYVEYMARKIAEIKKISFEEVAGQTTKNALELFRLL